MPFVFENVPRVHLLVGNGILRPSNRFVARVKRFLFPLVGYGTVEQRIKGLIETQKMQSYVHLLDWRSDIPQLLAASDLLVFPSIAPHFARPVIEAGAMGKPVVVSQLGSVAELVEHEITGIIVPPNNIQELAEAIVRILTDESLASVLGTAGYEQSLKRFNAAANISKTVAVYEEFS
jgi:glycosyltransferase involved in cell wall biosynthesis